jgi:outer membrane protein insertion porin family
MKYMVKKELIWVGLICWASMTFALPVKEVRVVDATGKTYDISSVEAHTSYAVGDEVIDRKALVEAMALDVGSMRDSGRYSYVDASIQLEDDGVVLIYEVEAKQRLRRIEIRGAVELGSKRVREKSELVLGALVDDSDFEAAVTKIKTAYQEFWYPNVAIEWTAVVDSDLGIVDLLIEIVEEQKIGIRKIRFSGNHLVESDKLRQLLTQKEKSFFSFIHDKGRYEAIWQEMDRFAIQKFYLDRGFLDVEVFPAELDKQDPLNATLTYAIQEGRHYRIGNVIVSGARKVDQAALENRVTLQAEEPASRQRIEAASEVIRAYYGDRGYVSTRVNPVLNADPLAGIVHVDFQIREGRQGSISRVHILGNERTKDEVIRRELVVLPGEIYNRSRLKTSENRLRNLNYFETVSVNAAPSGDRDEYDVAVVVKEKPTGQFNAGVGISSVDSLVGFVELSQGNFDWRAWPPVGGGQKFQARAQLGTERNDVELSFTEPWFLDRKLSFGASVYHRESRYFSDVYDQKTDGIRLSLGQPFSKNTRHSLAYKIEQFDVYDVADTASDAIKNEAGKRLSSGIEYTLSYDSRNRYFGATRGLRATVSPYVSGGLLGGETDIYGLQIKGTHHAPLIGGMVFTTRVQTESVDTFGDSAFVPIFDRLFLGGSYTLRGYEYREVGPRDEDINSDSIGGNTYAFASTELTFPLWDNVRGAVFYDWGFVNKEAWDFDVGMYNDNYGVGLRLSLPGFPLQLDYAWPIQYHEERGETGKPRFNFLLGHTY